MQILAVIQARLDSKRLPHKVVRQINDKTLIEILLNRLSKSKLISQIVVATGIDQKNTELVKIVNDLKFDCYRGDDENVLKRYFDVAHKLKADAVVRITADCPLIDPTLVDQVINKFIISDADYASNTLNPTYPDGLDVEVFKLSALSQAYNYATSTFDKEHVTPYMKRSSSLKRESVENPVDYSSIRITVDEPEDFLVIEKIMNEFYPSLTFGWLDIIELIKYKPEIFEINSHFQRNEGQNMKNTQKIWRRALSVIPDGNSLLSKRPDFFLPEGWPTYYEKSKGCTIWDLDGLAYTDLSLMGVGTNILGYSNDELNSKLFETLEKGTSTTLNSFEEVLLAEKLIELHPWAQMVKFARSGGEANTIALRIARAASGKHKVAFCGYHGWHDWYLSANINDNSTLTPYLLKNLETKGIPSVLGQTAFPFKYNDLDSLEKITSNHDIGIIFMEVERNFKPENEFLQRVREIANKTNSVLIFDECTSGFRETFGGLHKKYGVTPDLAVFGKALGNGHPISAVIGIDSVMKITNKTFVSSTFWSERLGFTAALKTLDIMEKQESWNVITNSGKYLKTQWNNLFKMHALEVEIFGLDAMPSFKFSNKNHQALKTFITQEMLSKKYLATDSVYLSIAHERKYLDEYFSHLSMILSEISKFENSDDVFKKLKHPVSQSGFKRLN